MSVVTITAISLTEIKMTVAVMMGQVYERKPESGSAVLVRPDDTFGKSYLEETSRHTNSSSDLFCIEWMVIP